MEYALPKITVPALQGGAQCDINKNSCTCNLHMNRIILIFLMQKAAQSHVYIEVVTLVTSPTVHMAEREIVVTDVSAVVL